jgi:serine-type D-Ala-D-Ala carboxypeptidase
MWTKVNQLLHDAVSEGIFPGCALSIRHNSKEIHNVAFGNSEQRPSPRKATVDTVWDVASITKVLCTAHLYLKWCNDGLVDINSLIVKELPEAPDTITIADCLSHSSGYDNWRPFYSMFLSELHRWKKNAVRSKILNAAVRSKPFAIRRSMYRYSDIGYLVLCAYAEARFGKPIHLLWQEYLPEEARKGLYWGHPDAAATEDCPVRGKVIIGETHDLNAAAMGGKSTHAGLFGTVSAISSTASWALEGYHGRTEELEPDVVQYFWNYRGTGSHCLGWDTPSPSGSSASNLWPSNGVGHLGFTGTSLWIAPTENLVVAFASNRVHPIVEEGSFPGRKPHSRTIAYRKFRPQLHELIFQLFNEMY